MFKRIAVGKIFRLGHSDFKEKRARQRRSWGTPGKNGEGSGNNLKGRWGEKQGLSNKKKTKEK